MAVEALLRVLALPSGAIWEPACGRGAIANVLRDNGHRVVCTDLIDYGADSTAIYGVDFLKTTELPADVACILTNPPFKLVNQFIAHALALCPNVIMLARLALLESERRSSVLEGCGLRRVFKRLPMMHRDGWDGRKANSGMAFAWFVWKRGYRGHPMTQRISWEHGRDAAPLLLPHGRPAKGSRSGSHIKRGANRAYVLARLRRDGRVDLIEQVESGALSARRALAAIADRQSSR